MALTTTSAVLDGVSGFSFNAPGVPDFEWNNDSFTGGLDFLAAPGTRHAVALDLAGSWTVRDLTFTGPGETSVVMTDLDDAGRLFELLQFFDGTSAMLDFTSTGARAVTTGGPGTHQFLLGAGYFEQIAFRNPEAVTVVQEEGGIIESLIVSSWGDAASENALRLDGRVGAVQLHNSDNAVQIGGTVDYMGLWNSGSLVFLEGEGQVSMLQASGGGAAIAFEDNARAFALKLDRGDYLVTTEDGHIESYYSHGADNTVLIGDGGLGQMTISGDGADGRGGTQYIDAEGWLGMLNVMHDNDVFLLTGDGGAGSIRLTNTGHSLIHTGEGWVNAIYLWQGSNQVMIGSGGAGSISAYGAENFITTSDAAWNGPIIAEGDNIIFTGSGFVHSISTYDGDDLIVIGSGGAGFVQTGLGNDTVRGGRDDDLIILEGGNNTVWAGRGDDTVYGGTDDDRIGGGAGDDLIYANAGNNTLRGGAGDDTLFGGDGNDIIYGGNHDDLILGGDGNNALWGGAGNDTIHGGDNGDTIGGGAGDDALHGGAGDDVIRAGSGNDQIWGGGGADSFYFVRNNEENRIHDFDFDEGDMLMLAPGLWRETGQTLDTTQVVDRFASVNEAGDTVLDFGGGNTVISLLGITDLNLLADHIEIL